MFADRRIRTSLIAILADSVLVVIKLLTAWVTGSAALLADAYHSITDFAVSLILLLGLITRYFQEKTGNPQAIARAYRLESFLAVLVALLILYVPIEILQAIHNRPNEELQHIWVGIIGVLLCIAIAWFMSRLKTLVGRDTDSPALEADGYHSQLDVLSSIAVLLSLLGAMIGIYLDELVAVIIAVMVAVAGLELLFSGLRSLFKGGELEQLSLLETLSHKLNQQHTWQRSHQILLHYYQTLHKGWLLAVCGLFYSATGFSSVQHGHIGIRQVLDYNLESELNAGLHYAPPWPFGAIQQLPIAQTQRITLAHPEPSNEVDKTPSFLWQQRFLNDPAHPQDAQLLTTSDEHLVHISASLHYQVPAALQLRTTPETLQQLLTQFTQAALAQQVAQTDFHTLLQIDRQTFAQQVNTHLHREMQASGLNIPQPQLHIQVIQPPTRVVAAYRDAFNAQQEQQQLQRRAEGQRLSELSQAQSKYINSTNQTAARRLEQRLHAQGDAERFQLLATWIRRYPQLMRFNLYLDTISQQLRDKQLTLVSPVIHSTDRRIWQIAPSSPIPTAPRR